MGTVTIGSDTFSVYGTTAGFASYANGSWSWSATYAAAASNDTKRAHVEASRLLDRQTWDGSLTANGQALAWPRDGVSGTPPGLDDPPDDGTTPDCIVFACYELALAMLANVSSVAGTSTASNVQSVGAGAASVSFFYPKTGGRFPERVMELISWALGSSVSSDIGALGVYVSGDDGESEFDSCDEYGLSGAG